MRLGQKTPHTEVIIMKVQHIIENLIGTHQYRDKTWDEIFQTLKNSPHEISVLGSGSFADVISSPEWKYVYKIYQRDSAYTSFIHFCTQHQDNPHLPKILKPPKKLHAFHKRSHLSSDHLYAVKLEKLYDLNDINYKIVEFVSDYAYHYTNSNHLLHDPFDPNSSRVAEYTLDDLIDMYPKYPIRQLLDTIKQIFSKCRFRLDLHDGNFLQRLDGTIVIIDPLYEPNDIPTSIDFIQNKTPDDFRDIKPQTKTIQGPTYKK